ncbi:MAG: zinc ribbon domain-containing protein [Clostridia bacterium]|nr:zinc ribbon domain-containing protein [Clostridia bacterium]
MANWKESISNFAQNALNKSKGIAETTRLNLDIINNDQKIKSIHQEIGQYICEHLELVTADETLTALLASITELKEKNEVNNAAISEVKARGKCANCGATLNANSKFCAACGTPVPEEKPAEAEAAPAESAAAEAPVEENAVVYCSECGEVLQNGAVFCGNCGKKQ